MNMSPGIVPNPIGPHQRPDAGDSRFDGEPTIYFLMICDQCEMALPFQFDRDRDAHASGHANGTGHVVRKAVDVRPDPVHQEKINDAVRQQILDAGIGMVGELWMPGSHEVVDSSTGQRVYVTIPDRPDEPAEWHPLEHPDGTPKTKGDLLAEGWVEVGAMIEDEPIVTPPEKATNPEAGQKK